MVPRLYISSPLSASAELTLTDAPLHYIRNVMRLPEKSYVHLFNGTDGQWQARIDEYSKKSARLTCTEMMRPQTPEKPLTLMCSLIKPARLEFLMEKATELGVTHIQPLVSDHCSVRRVNNDRLTSHTIEAAEQSERLSIPQIHEITSLREAVATFEGQILWADESRGQSQSILDVFAKTTISALLIGPEGGFSPAEKDYLHAQPNVHPIQMGPLILRAETAGLALIAAYQTNCGTWR